MCLRNRGEAADGCGPKQQQRTRTCSATSAPFCVLAASTTRARPPAQEGVVEGGLAIGRAGTPRHTRSHAPEARGWRGKEATTSGGTAAVARHTQQPPVYDTPSGPSSPGKERDRAPWASQGESPFVIGANAWRSPLPDPRNARPSHRPSMPGPHFFRPLHAPLPPPPPPLAATHRRRPARRPWQGQCRRPTS